MTKTQMFVAFWRAMLLVGVTGEMIAFVNAVPDDTLSERVARWQHAVPVFRFILGGFMAWLTVHFWTATVEPTNAVRFVWSGRELIQIWLVSLLAFAVVRFWPR